MDYREIDTNLIRAAHIVLDYFTQLVKAMEEFPPLEDIKLGDMAVEKQLAIDFLETANQAMVLAWDQCEAIGVSNWEDVFMIPVNRARMLGATWAELARADTNWDTPQGVYKAWKGVYGDQEGAGSASEPPAPA